MYLFELKSNIFYRVQKAYFIIHYLLYIMLLNNNASFAKIKVNIFLFYNIQVLYETNLTNFVKIYEAEKHSE